MYKKIGTAILTLWMFLSFAMVIWANPDELAGTQGETVVELNFLQGEIAINSSGPDIGIVGADTLTSVQNLQAVLSSLGIFNTVDIISYEWGAGASLAELLNYGAVLVYNNSQLFAAGFGDTLGDYVDAGGGVVLATFLWQQDPLAGSKIMSPGYSPFSSDGWGHYSWAGLGWYDPAHPIMNGVIGVDGYYRDEVNLTGGAVLVAAWNDGEEFAAVNANNTVVGITLFPGLGWYGDPVGDWDILLANALLYVSTIQIEVAVDIKPETLNLKSKGEFSAFINLPEGYDEADIVLDSVECEGAPALKGVIADDVKFVVKFDSEDLNDVPTGDAVELTVTGELTDGTLFKGSDTVRVIGPGKPAPSLVHTLSTTWGDIKSRH